MFSGTGTALIVLVTLASQVGNVWRLAVGWLAAHKAIKVMDWWLNLWLLSLNHQIKWRPPVSGHAARKRRFYISRTSHLVQFPNHLWLHWRALIGKVAGWIWGAWRTKMFVYYLNGRTCHHIPILILPSTITISRSWSFLRSERLNSIENLPRNLLSLRWMIWRRNCGVLLSAHALKIRSYAPDLAKIIAGLIFSSNDSNFQGECVSLLGFDCQEIETETVEACVKERIISVIEMNDRKPQKSREATPFLFEDEGYHEHNCMDEEYEEGEEAFNSLEL